MTPYVKELRFNVFHFTTPIKEEKELIIIVDEADEFIAKNAVKFRDNGSLGGFTSL